MTSPNMAARIERVCKEIDLLCGTLTREARIEFLEAMVNGCESRLTDLRGEDRLQRCDVPYAFGRKP